MQLVMAAITTEPCVYDRCRTVVGRGVRVSVDRVPLLLASSASLWVGRGFSGRRSVEQLLAGQVWNDVLASFRADAVLGSLAARRGWARRSRGRARACRSTRARGSPASWNIPCALQYASTRRIDRFGTARELEGSGASRRRPGRCRRWRRTRAPCWRSSRGRPAGGWRGRRRRTRRTCRRRPSCGASG